MALRYTCVCGGPACGAGRQRRRRGRRRQCHVHGWQRTQETSETRWCLLWSPTVAARSQGPRARETAGASSRASCESIGDGGSGVSAARRGGFLQSGEVFVQELPLAGARRWKGDTLAAAARHCFFEAGGGELARGGGEGGWALVDAALVWRAPQLGFRFGAPLGSRRQGAVPFPKRVRGGGGLSQVPVMPQFKPNS
jgi:hypothetical protein